MRIVKTFTITIIISIPLFTSCKSVFKYEHKLARITNPNGISIILSPRNNTNADIDETFKDGLLRFDISNIIKDEIVDTGLIKQLTIINNSESPISSSKIHSQFILHYSFNKLKWMVPEYKSKLIKTAVLGILTFGIGAIIYSMQNTEVYCDAELHFEIHNIRTNNVILSKTYSYNYQTQSRIQTCDGLVIKNKVASEAIHEIMKRFKLDFKNVINH